jgi:putative ABC transport system ATP-binding protein
VTGSSATAPTTGSGAPLVSWCSVSRVYPGAVVVEALKPTTWSMAAGEYIAITGPSGSGKSTLLNVLGLLDRPSTGVYKLGDVDVSNLGEHPRAALRGKFFGFVFQAFHLLARQTVVENVELGLLYANVGRAERTRRADEALVQVGMAHRRDAEPSTLSGGERQRVAIARALAGEPQVILCDEPTGNLDSANAAKVLGLLDELNDLGVAVVVVTHDQVVSQRARRVISFQDGELVSDSGSRP